MALFRRIGSLTSGTLQVIFILLFLVVYSLITFRLAGPQPDCLSVRDFADQLRRYELQLDAAGLLHRLADQSSTPLPAREGRRPSTGDVDRRRGLPKAAVIDELRPAVDTTTRAPLYFVYDSVPHDQLLNSSFAPNVIYYLWCGRRWFEFQHYLSVMSVIRLLRPDNIVFCYDHEPIIDSWIYNTWYSEIAESYPFFRRHRLLADEPGCVGHATPNMTFVRSYLLTSMGGMYVNEHTILSRYPLDLRLKHLVVGFDRTSNDDTVPALLATKPGLPGQRSLRQVLADRRLSTEQLTCYTVNEYVRANRKSACVVVDSSSSWYPRDIWELGDSFGRLARTVFYGTPEIRRPLPRYDDQLIPNIAHIVWLGGGPMDFLFYLCVASLIYVARVDAVYIHGDGPPTGFYWKLIKDNPKLHLIYRQHPSTVYGQEVNVLSHMTDVWRVDFMIRYGGIYVDTDVVFVRPLDRDIRGYDAVGSYDWTYWNHPFPDTINFGVALGKRNAPYWHKFQESMKWFKDNDWAWNGLRQPYRIKERHPDLVLIDPHLQVICYQSLCHPTWWPDYHNESVHHLNSNSIGNWRTDVYAFHWTLPTPFELKDHVNLLSKDSIFSEIGKYVLEKAGTLQHFRDLARKQSVR